MPSDESLSFAVDARDEGDGVRFDVTAGDGRSASYLVAEPEAQAYFEFFRSLHRDFGTRLPHFFVDRTDFAETPSSWQPLLTDNVSPKILAGYGDPAVLKTDDGYYLLATSNDAPDAFPILHSDDLIHWEHKGFVFPEDHQPEWTAKGRHVADFWAPEMAKVGDDYWVAYTARHKNNALAIGLARADNPLSTFTDKARSLVTGKEVNTTGVPHGAFSGGVIDSHVFTDADGSRYLFWKDDANGICPRPLAVLLRERADLIERSFECA